MISYTPERRYEPFVLPKYSATMKLTALSMFLVASVAGSNAIEKLEAAVRSISLWEVAAWSIAPGIVGGLAMQMISDKMKGRRQFAGELLTSMVAGFIVGPLSFRWIPQDDPLKLLYVGGASALAGFFGSLTLLFLAERARKRLRTPSEFFNER